MDPFSQRNFVLVYILWKSYAFNMTLTLKRKYKGKIYSIYLFDKNATEFTIIVLAAS